MSDSYWVDIGVNLTDNSFDKDRDEVLSNAIETDVQQLIITGTSLEESLQAIELCQHSSGNLFCTVGVHPHYAKDHSKEQLSELKALSTEACVVAIGETGLDFNRNFSTPEKQLQVFEYQLELAAETSLPLFLHEREAHQRQLELLSYYRDDFPNAVAHCFTGSRDELFNYLDLDLYIGVTGWICDERRGEELQKLVKEIPSDRLLLETDAPYLIPRDLRPKPKSRRNLPIYLPHIANRVAQLCQIDIETLKNQTTLNAQELFKLPPLMS